MTAVVLASPSPILQFFNNAGQVNAGGSLLTQVGGVNYPTYQDAAGATALPNPIPLNSRGEVSNATGVSSQLFLVQGVTYTFTLYDAIGNQINQATSVSTLLLSAGSITFLAAGTGAVVRNVQDRLQDTVDAFDYMSAAQISDVRSNTGSIDVTAALQAAFNAAATVHLPNGRYMTSALTWPTTLRQVTGESRDGVTLVPSGTITGYSNFISIPNVTGFLIERMTIDLSPTTYPTVWGIGPISCTDGFIRDIVFPHSGSAAIRGSGCTNVIVERVAAANWNDSGITFPNATAANNRIKVKDCYVPGTGTQTSHNINVIGGANHQLINNYTTNNVVGSFGLNLYQANSGVIADNICGNGVAEGINIQNCYAIAITGNVVASSASSGDFGISLYGDNISGGMTSHCTVTGNTIYRAGKAGIALAYNVAGCTVTGNHIYQCNESGQTGANAALGAGVVVYGGLAVQNVVANNHLYDDAGKMTYAVAEFNDGTGNPSGTQFIDNVYTSSGAGGLFLGEFLLASTNSQVWATQWASYTPVPTATGGNPTTTVNAAQYRVRGKTVEIQWDLTFSALNGATAGLTIPLPPGFTAPTNGGCLSGREINTNGWMVAGLASGSAAIVLNYNNAFPIAATSRLAMSGIYRAA